MTLIPETMENAQELPIKLSLIRLCGTFTADLNNIPVTFDGLAAKRSRAYQTV
jgi:hypothetical protein